jgi:hypothetical protein
MVSKLVFDKVAAPEPEIMGGYTFLDLGMSWR